MPQSAHLAGLPGPSVVLHCLEQSSKAGMLDSGSEAPKIVVIIRRNAADNAVVCLHMQSLGLE